MKVKPHPLWMHWRSRSSSSLVLPSPLPPSTAMGRQRCCSSRRRDLPSSTIFPGVRNGLCFIARPHSVPVVQGRPRQGGHASRIVTGLAAPYSGDHVFEVFLDLLHLRLDDVFLAATG